MRRRSRRAAGLGALIALALALAGCAGDDSDDGATPTTAPLEDGTPSEEAVDPDTLPGIQTGPAPWRAELDHLRERLDAIGLPALKQEGQVLDYHIVLEVEVEGRQVRVPNSIGLNGQEVAGGRMATGFVSAIHTHDDSGLVHVHSPNRRVYTLGQIFDVWGVRLTAQCVGGHCAEGGKVVTVLDDGDEVEGHVRSLELRDRQRITVRYGEP